MTLPQAIAEAIEKEAEHYANVQWTEKAKHMGHEQSRNWDHSKDDYEAGATEWAGKAEGLIKALEELVEWHTKTFTDGLERRIHNAKTAVAKYKEVSNG